MATVNAMQSRTLFRPDTEFRHVDVLLESLRNRSSQVPTLHS